MNKVFFASSPFFNPLSSPFLEDWILEVSLKEKARVGSVFFVPLKGKDLLFLNKKHLGHNYNTDVITFDYSKKNFISGEILFSVCDVKKNAALFQSSVEDEFLRVMVHGFLHLLGYCDSKKKDAKIMQKKEDFYVALYYDLFHVKPTFKYV